MELRRREVFMNVPAVRPALEQSFEEQRVNDYLKAYIATGRPPRPCPVQPTDKAERQRAGLPPLFEPYIEVDGNPAPLTESAAVAISQVSLQLSARDPPRDVSELPEVQAFQPTRDTSESGSKVYLQNIVCQHLYSAFSPEELRLKAYSNSKIYAPEAIPSPVPANPEPSSSNERPQSISAMAPYSGHSLEELRLAYLRTGRELTSEQITQMRVLD